MVNVWSCNQVQFVLTAMIIYHAKSGHCLVVWSKVTQLKKIGGPGISDLKTLSMALRVR
jgi:hypothetical protein